jgi:hypothetical protein
MTARNAQIPDQVFLLREPIADALTLRNRLRIIETSVIFSKFCVEESPWHSS